jgi:pyruvate dehydrogenase E1 component alpha subunit
MNADLSSLRTVLRVRRFEELLLTAADEINGHYHVSTGLEGVAAALAEAFRPGDRVVTNYRNHGHLIALGSDPKTMYGEIFGRGSGPQRGRSGSFHLADPDRGVLYTSAMVAGGLPISLGIAFALSRRPDQNIVFCFFGDGAVQEGCTHEVLNIAQLWRLPVLFVCENNGLPVDGNANDSQSAPSLETLASAHGIYATTVDARRPRDVVEIAGALAERVRTAEGPAFLDARTAPWRGNDEALPVDVTGPTDLRHALKTSNDPWYDNDDPVLREVRDVLEAGTTLEAVEALDRQIVEEMRNALEDARSLPSADAAFALSDVLSEQ